MVGALLSAATSGLLALAATGGMIWASNTAMAAVIEHGTESLVEYAASQGRTQTEAERFARTAVWAVETLITGVVMVGIAKLIKNSGAIKTKIHSLKINVAQIAKNAFQRRQASQVKIDTTSLEGIAKAVEQSQTVQIQKALRPGEGKVGSYVDIKGSNPKRSGLAAHHMPSANYMEKLGIDYLDAIAMNVEHPLIKTTPIGRHQQTRTYGGKSKIESGLAPRDELAADIHDMRKIYQRDGLYTTDIKDSLLEVIEKNKTTFPELFGKDAKK
jgi:hypothetical protein